MNSLVGEEKIEASANRPSNYLQRKSFTTQPIIGGVVGIKAEIKTIVNRAWQKVTEYCDALSELPLEGFQSDAAFEIGLTGDFVAYIAVLYAENSLRYQEQYKAGKEYELSQRNLFEAMHALKKYEYDKGSDQLTKLDLHRRRPTCSTGIGGRRGCSLNMISL
jgi:hypothetical protein